MVAVIAVFGPTASGKTAVAETIADRLGTDVVSCDALQVYRGLPILTNQPARPTALVAIRELSEAMSVGAYATLAHVAIDERVAMSGSAVVSGGTGLYLRAALADMAVPPPPGAGVRERILAEIDTDSGTRVWQASTHVQLPPCTSTTRVDWRGRSSLPRPGVHSSPTTTDCGDRVPGIRP
jgi:tRNA dimethylallyltransferase